MLNPIIKWSGSKRYQAEAIVNLFPKKINTYYELFLGGGSVLGEFLTRLDNKTIECNNIVCCDNNKDLIDLWIIIKDNPKLLIEEYSKLYETFSSFGLDYEGKKKFYYDNRNKYNEFRKNNIFNTERTIIFNWLLRTCFNGLIRYNKYDEFNTSCHFTRNGIIPKNLEKIIDEWSVLLNKFNVEFLCCSYDELPFPLNVFTKDDIMYFDPPYPNSGGSQYSFDEFDNDKFFEWLKQLPCKYLLSYDGKSGKDDRTYNVSESIYNEHIYLDSGLSAFKKLIGKGSEEVKDSLYIKNARS